MVSAPDPILGARPSPEGVDFAVHVGQADRVELLLFDHARAKQPSRLFVMNPPGQPHGGCWSLFVPGVQPGQLYGYRVQGPHDPARGLRCDPDKLLLDPYTRAVANLDYYDRQAAARPGDNCGTALKSVVHDFQAYDWEGDRPLRRPWSETVLYELHVRGFTRSPESGLAPELRGTYAGLAEKVPYLADLGVTALELLPIHQFDPYDAPEGRRNYWGYSSLGFFAPHSGYSSRVDPLGAVDEFRDLVKACHRAGLEVILDVVFNHTAEIHEIGPYLSFRGLDNPTYYLLENDRSLYANFSGCGNVLNANHPVVSRLILDSLRYWVSEMHVDGFRFDLASALTRGPDGAPLDKPPLLVAMENDPLLAHTKLIAEAWDAAGLYQVGAFPGVTFAEWNGPFRDDVRRFLRGEEGMVSNLATRLAGSPDLFQKPGRKPHHSLNFITCHDGFTLNDLVSYQYKHNSANGENNRDGSEQNFSCNFGMEGYSAVADVNERRERQIRTFLALLLLPRGTPMLLMGDEIRRTQQGNNNAYCQDSPLTWFPWSHLETGMDQRGYLRNLIQLVREHPALGRDAFLSESEAGEGVTIVWHGIEPGQPDWSDPSHSLACTLTDQGTGESLYLVVNAYFEELTFHLPKLPAGKVWRRVLDTALPAAEACCPSGKDLSEETGSYRLLPHTCVALRG